MKRSAGILVYRKRSGCVDVLLVHPGGPFWIKRNEGVWSIPKGEVEKGQDLLDNAIREFEEETGLVIENADRRKIFYLGEVKSKNKIVFVYALEKDFGENFIIGDNLIEVEWPPRSGRIVKFPEVDRVEYFDLAVAFDKLVDYQKKILEMLKSYC